MPDLTVLAADRATTLVAAGDRQAMIGAFSPGFSAGFSGQNVVSALAAHQDPLLLAAADARTTFVLAAEMP